MPRKRSPRREKTTRAVSYFRTSSKAQDEENSQDRQQYHTRLKGKQLGLQIVDEFSDVGSGLDSETLPGFTEMMEFVRDPQKPHFQPHCRRLEPPHPGFGSSPPTVTGTPTNRGCYSFLSGRTDQHPPNGYVGESQELAEQ